MWRDLVAAARDLAGDALLCALALYAVHLLEGGALRAVERVRRLEARVLRLERRLGEPSGG